MNKKIIIIQIESAILALKEYCKKEFPDIIDSIIFSSSFNDAVELIPREGELVVLTRQTFFDTFNKSAKEAKYTIPENQKSASSLAKIIKGINQAAKVYAFSVYPPGKEYLDGYYEQRWGGANSKEELKFIFWDLGLVERPELVMQETNLEERGWSLSQTREFWGYE